MLTASALGQTYTIDAFAGGGLPSTPTAATSAAVHPYGVAVDGAGNVYFSTDAAIFKFDASGTLTRVAGVPGGAAPLGDGGLATSARICGREAGIALDSGNNLYITDYCHQRVRKVTPAGVISTVAGDGTLGYSGDGGPATSAQLALSSGVSMDAGGNFYIADTTNHAIRKVTPDGIISTVAGNGMTGYSSDGGPATRATLNSPQSTVLDAGGNLYIADSGNRRIRMVTPAGTISTVAGTGTSGYSGDGGPAANAQIGSPSGMTFDAAGNLYFSDAAYNCIRKIAPSGIISKAAGICRTRSGYSGDGGPAADAEFSSPRAVAVDSAGNLYIADSGNLRLRKVTPEGSISTAAGNGSVFAGDGGPATVAQMNQPFGVAVDADSRVLIVDRFNHRVRRVASDGTISTVAGTGTAGYSGDGGPATSARLAFPSGAAVDSQGNIYIADTSNVRIRKVTREGTISTIAGIGASGNSGDGGPAVSARLSVPGGVAVDPGGSLYIADTGNHSVRKVTATGTISTVMSSRDGLSAPASVAVAPSGTLYVVSSGHRIFQMTPAGTISAAAGTGGGGFSGDGGPAALAQLWAPSGVATDAAGNLYIADTANLRIRKVTPGGIISTVAGRWAVGYSGDGGPATAARFASPGGLAVDAAGKIYVADQANGAVRVLTPSACTPSLSSTVLQVPVEGQRLSIAIEAGAGCAWSVAELPTWITVAGEASGSASGNVTLVVAPNPTEPRTVQIAIAGVSVKIDQASTVLAVTSGGAVNAASYGATVAAGSIAAVFGNYLLPTGYPVTAFPLPTVLGGVSFQFLDSPLAPFFYAGPSQANLQIPWELASKTQATVYVSGNGRTSMAKVVTLAAYAPGIFTVNGQGTGQGAILDANYRLVDSSNPVAAGSGVLQIYCTGLGPVSNQPATGAPAPANPLARTSVAPAVVIGGVQVTPDFSGLTPGTVGLYQVNVNVPADSPKGNDVPVYLTIGGVRSNIVTIAVK